MIYVRAECSLLNYFKDKDYIDMIRFVALVRYLSRRKDLKNKWKLPIKIMSRISEMRWNRRYFSLPVEYKVSRYIKNIRDKNMI